MTTPQPAALPELPHTTYSLFYEQPGDLEDEGYQYVLDEPGYTADQMRAYALATLQAQPAEVSDAEIDAAWVKNGGGLNSNNYRAFARTILALRPQAVPMTEEQRQQAFAKSWATSSDFFAGIEAAEAHHGITAPAGGEVGK